MVVSTIYIGYIVLLKFPFQLLIIIKSYSSKLLLGSVIYENTLKNSFSFILEGLGSNVNLIANKAIII